MADLLMFGRLADARRARPRRLKRFNAHLHESDVKSRFRFGRDSINYLARLLSDNLARNAAFRYALPSPWALTIRPKFWGVRYTQIFGNSTISVFSGTFPTKFPYHLSLFRKFRSKRPSMFTQIKKNFVLHSLRSAFPLGSPCALPLISRRTCLSGGNPLC